MSSYACTGKYADNPYSVPGLECNVYSIEELCYVIKENAFLLDMTLMNDGLVDWIAKSLMLPDLAKELYPMIHKKGSLSGFAVMILEYVGLYDSAEISQVGQLLKQGTGLSGIEKKKTQLDRLLDKGRYVPLLRGYDALLKTWEELENDGKEVPAISVKASILHNKGVVYTALMLYAEAANCFYDSYLVLGDREELMTFLAAKRLELSDKEYIDFVASKPEYYEVTLALEKEMEKVGQEFLEHPKALELERRKQWRRGNERNLYDDESNRLTLQLKNEYRDCVVE